MTLAEIYEEKGIEDKHRLKGIKPLVVVKPSEDYNIENDLKRLGIDPMEVESTYPKDGISLAEEIELSGKEVIQVGKKLLDDFPCFRGKKKGKDVLTSIKRGTKRFVNLHHHDEYSIRDGLGKISDFTDYLCETGRTFCPITNHGTVGGWIKQYDFCREKGLKAIFGVECYVNDVRSNDPEVKKKNRSNYHMIMLARNLEGFYNIIRIQNDANLNGFYYKPRVNYEAMKKWGKGIIASSACYSGVLSKLVLEDKWEEAKDLADFFRECFDGFYIELVMIDMEEQIDLNNRLIRLADETGIPLIVTLDSHYIMAEHSKTHELLLLIRDKKTVLDKKDNPEEVWQFDAGQLYYRDYSGLKSLWRDGFEASDGRVLKYENEIFNERVFEKAVDNTRKIALECEDIEIDSSIKLPRIAKKSQQKLKEEVIKGLKSKGLENQKEYIDRLKEEFEVIFDKGFSDYFLIMQKIIVDTKKKYGDGSVGIGRGSAAGSLVSYCLGITGIDPLPYGLLFSRFLDASRADPPDIDVDFDPRIRDKVKQYIVEEFGDNKTCSIGTCSTYKTRQVILDVVRALGLDVREVNKITKKMDILGKFDVEGDDGENESMKLDKMPFDAVLEQYPEMGSYLEQHPNVRKHAELLRNQASHVGKHAGGMIISDRSLTDIIPVVSDKNGVVSSEWVEGQEEQQLGGIGLVKFDLLGLSNLSVVSDCLGFVNESRKKKIRFSEIPVNDKESIVGGVSSDLMGIFQLENPFTKHVAKDIGIDCLEDVSALTSLIRPGPKDMGMHEVYARRKNGESYGVIDCIKDILEPTHGVLTYQEQVMRIAQRMAGFTGSEANKMRKAMGKKIAELMATFRDKFIKGCQPRIDNGEFTEEEATEMFDLIEKFAAYGFNKSHSIAYSVLTTKQLWLKFRYPAQYIAALLNNTKQGQRKSFSDDAFKDYLMYARKRGIRIIPPDVNKSGFGFTMGGDSIRYGLGKIKGLGKAAQNIVENSPYESFEDFYNRVNKRVVNKGVVVKLIASGAFSSFGERNELLDSYSELRGSKGKKKESFDHKTSKEWEREESERLGSVLTDDPLYYRYKEKIVEERWCPIGDADNRNTTKVLGRVDDVIFRTSRNGNDMYIVSMSDDINTLTFFVFTKNMQFFKNNVNTGNIIAVKLAKFDDSNTRFLDSRCDVDIIEK